MSIHMYRHMYIYTYIHIHICIHTEEEKEDMVIHSKKMLNKQATTALETLMQRKVHIK